MCMLTRSRLGLLVPVFCLVLFAGTTARAQLSITAYDDIPGPVTIIVEAKDAAGGNLQAPTTTLWTGNSNTYSTQAVSIPSGTRILRFTFRNDCCGMGCGGGCQVCNPVTAPDCDRNAAIDSFTAFGVARQGEDFDRVGNDGPNLPCAAASLGGKTAAVCGQEGAYAEYDIAPPPEPIPAASAWGLAILVLALLVGARVYFGRRFKAQVVDPMC